MQVLERRGYGAASISFGEVHEGLACGRLHGPLTVRVLGRLVEDWAVIAAGAEAVVVDLSGVFLLASLEEISRTIEPQFQNGLMRRPTALVCSQQHAPMLKEWAWRAAHYGVMRDVFPDQAQALAWARDRAASLRAEAIYRCGTCA